MRKAAAITLAFTAASFTAFTQTTDAQELFNRIRGKVRSDLLRAPRYTCVQTITRIQYHPPYAGNPRGCPALIAARAATPLPGRIVWRDRLRFDVAVGENGEMFSWAGATQFDTGDIGSLALSGSTGSGDFASFLSAVFGPDAEQFHYLGVTNTPFGPLPGFDFKVPQPKSHYTYKSEGKPGRIIGYEGSFYADPDTGDLKRMIVDTTEFPPGDSFCHVADTMDYGRVKIGEGEFLLPNSAKMVILYSNGEESHNEKRYSGCKEFTGTSTIRFDEDEEEGERSLAAKAKAALKAVPPNTRMRIKIDPPIDSERAAAGDPIIGIVDKEVKQKGQVVIRATDRLHGRILRFEQFFVPDPHWIVALRFDTIERDGVEQPAAFGPIDDGDRRSMPQTRGRRLQVQTAINELERPKGGGIFVFSDNGKLVLGKNFQSEWAIR